ncbi:Uncharacterised protein [Vibrio cholerae]|nr:Uncharacterised protein [Vibrio cholerae]
MPGVSLRGVIPCRPQRRSHQTEWVRLSVLRARRKIDRYKQRKSCPRVLKASRLKEYDRAANLSLPDRP